jgi:hypothetical protein
MNVRILEFAIQDLIDGHRFYELSSKVLAIIFLIRFSRTSTRYKSLLEYIQSTLANI